MDERGWAVMEVQALLRSDIAQEHTDFTPNKLANVVVTSVETGHLAETTCKHCVKPFSERLAINEDHETVFGVRHQVLEQGLIAR